MAKPYNVDKDLLSYAHEIISTTRSLDNYKRALSVVLSSDLGLTTNEIANFMRISPRTVSRLRGELAQIFNGDNDPR
ncbi:MAG: hypothetical protein LBS60_04160 [Deltaproteobacteria bacterium]|jgi:DNA-binding NarL/FixJ family response regulator|nr:hypothetical protein [Deltaproteobacteria bacterium]